MNQIWSDCHQLLFKQFSPVTWFKVLEVPGRDILKKKERAGLNATFPQVGFIWAKWDTSMK
jgi:hypothetical protein